MTSQTPIIWLDSVDSTNEEAHRRALSGETGPLWIAAREQTAGRGRRGRVWRKEQGDLAATLLLRPTDIRPGATLAEAATLSFAICLALSDAVLTLSPKAPVALKWPNDVLLGGGKLSGVLLENRGGALAIGIGVNILHAPDAAALEPDAVPAAALADAVSPPPTPEHLLETLAAAFSTRLDAWRRDGFAALRGPWRARAAGLGGPILARAMHETVRGRFVDVDADGALVIETSDGVRRLHAADVFLERG